MKIRLGGNIAVENPENSSDYDFNTFAGDIIIEYKLDEDGNYRISGFNQTEYEDVIEGEVNKTGLSFIFQRSFYKMSELLKPKEKKEAKNNNQNE